MEHNRSNHEMLDSQTMSNVDLRFWNLLGSNRMITQFPPDLGRGVPVTRMSGRDIHIPVAQVSKRGKFTWALRVLKIMCGDDES